MTIDQAAAEIKKWLKLAIALTFLVLFAITGIELLSFNLPGISGFPLTHGAGIGLAGMGFLYSKL